MKKLLLLLALLSSQFCFSQTWEEWFEQKKTQKKYLLEQIAALQVYLGYVKQGYTIANKGLTTIRNIKNGDFGLHHYFFESLKSVNPRVKSYAKVADIIAYQLRIMKETKQTLQIIKELRQFTHAEIEHCSMVFNNLLTDCLKNIEELILLITADQFEMKDDERIKRIDVLYADMQNKYAFSASFSEEMGLLSVQRMREQHEVNLSKKLNGLQ
jgi:hypothetical protein